MKSPKASRDNTCKADFTYVETLCQRFYASEVSRPGLPPGRYFRLLLIGYFESLGPELVIVWRAAVSFALREFRGLVWPEYLGLERRVDIQPWVRCVRPAGLRGIPSLRSRVSARRRRR